MISANVVNGTASAATFSLLITIGGRKGVALIDSGSTDSFIATPLLVKLVAP
jgi:hypothetical protein